ncbi:SitA5 family polymorphic toxin, partial [Corallococcus llansteffanensis]|uniref:SitA5 family polymorphic toxin n=1 Tax=Corallococcus llansteffanensis TaxID=2316731 RepID=UPI003FD7F0FE
MDARRAGVWLLLCVLVTGCAGGPTVRLRTGEGRERTYAPRTWGQRVPVSEGDFEEALSRLVLDVPLTVRPSWQGRVVRASAGEGALRDQGLAYLLRDRYGKWCRAHEAPVDCLSLLEQGAGFSAMDRLTLAVGMSLEPLRESLADAVEDTLDPAFFVSVVVGALVSWAVLAAAPEPVFTKAAAVLAAVVLAYLGIESFLAVVRACGTLKAATDRATTFQELEEAGETFGRVLGPEVARL